jgi:hypothetical protein
MVNDIKSLLEGFNSCSFKHMSRIFSVGFIPDCIWTELCTDVI